MIEAEREGGGFPPWRWREHDARYRFAAKFVLDRVVVDCACGAGFGTRQFVDAGARRVLAFDASPDAVATARKLVAGRAEIAVGDITSLSLTDASADVFISLETIEHVEDDGRYLAEVVRVLAPDGVFICSTPNRLVTNPGLAPDGKPQNPFHVREYSAAQFLALLSKRFRSIELRGQNPVPTAVSGVLGALGRVLPLRIATRMWQASKFHYLLPPFRKDHEVQAVRRGREYETLVAVCSHAIRS
jgi:SAM-dependent methyltransferase